MAVYLGYNGFISFSRKSIGGPQTFIVQPSEINAGAKRFRLSLSNGADVTNTYFTGDYLTFTRDSGNLDFIDPTGFGDSTKSKQGAWYIHVDEIGGVRLYNTLAGALAGTEAGAVALDPLNALFQTGDVNTSTETITVAAGLGLVVDATIKFRVTTIGTGAPSGTLPAPLVEGTEYKVASYNISTGALTVKTSTGTAVNLTTTGTLAGDNRFEVYQTNNFTVTTELKNNPYRVLAKTTGWELNTNREVVDVTVLSDQFRNQYSGLISGSGSLTAIWSFNLDDEINGEYSHYLLQLINRTEIGSEFGARLFLKTENTGHGAAVETELYYAFDGVITGAGVQMNPDSAVTVSVDFVTTSPIQLRLPTPSDELLVAAGEALLLDAGGDKLDL